MKKVTVLFCIFLTVLFCAACSTSQGPEEPAASSLPAAVSSALVPSASGQTDADDGEPASGSAAVSPSRPADTSVPSPGSSDLVVYFSRTGNTRRVADAIRQQTGADVFEIVPVTPYPEDYDECLDVAQVEKRENARPEFEGEIPDWDAYDRVFVGFPNWWGDMPMILYAFFDAYDFGGKTLAPFVTSSSSGFSGTRTAMETLEPDAILTDGLDLREKDLGEADQAVAGWLTQIEPGS